MFHSTSLYDRARLDRTVDNAIDDAIGQLRVQFPRVPDRILRDALRGYLERGFPLPRAIAAARRRIIDACAVV